jgi:hypothetical protein
MELTSIAPQHQRKSWRVLSPVEGRAGKKTRWVRVGRAYENRDGSTNVYLDALPTNGQLQLRDWEEWDDHKGGELSGARSAGSDSPTDSIPF